MDTLPSDALYQYLHELTSRVVAESGIPSDRHHLGKIILRSFKDAPDFVMQIDGGTGAQDTFQSALIRSVECASSLANYGLELGDVIVIIASNNIDLTIPMYAALYLGVAVAGMDMYLGVNELRDSLNVTVPKIVFCQDSNADVVKEALKQLDSSALIVTFNEKQGYMSFPQFLDKYADDVTVEDFRPADFDPAETIAILAATSGTTGVPKAAALTHKNIYIGFPSIFHHFDKFPSPIDVGIVLSPIQWVSALFQFIMSPVFRYTRVQTSLPTTREHVYYLINKYKPEFTICSPTYLTTLLKSNERHKCDFSSFRFLLVGGSAVPKDLVKEMKSVSPQVKIQVGYGLTETSGMVLILAESSPRLAVPTLQHLKYKFVDTVTDKEICEPNRPGELRLKGSCIFKGYFNNPEMTKATFDDDNWFKTGDIIYRDEHMNFYFTDRLKLLLKYRNHQVSPVEIESVIRDHPGVLDVAVTGVPDQECGDLPVAFVVLNDGFNVTEHEIKKLVKESLTDTKQLRGGVVFIKDLPLTSTSKVDRSKLKALAANLKTE